MCWLDHLSETEIAAVLATASRTAGPLSAAEARRVLTAASRDRQAGYSVAGITLWLSEGAVVARVIGRACQAQARARGEERGG